MNDDQKEVPEIQKGFEELMVCWHWHIFHEERLTLLQSNDWIYSQTPQFTFASSNKEEDEIAEKKLWEFPKHVRLCP